MKIGYFDAENERRREHTVAVQIAWTSQRHQSHRRHGGSLPGA